MSQPEVTLYYNNTTQDTPYDPSASGIYYPVIDTISGTVYSGTIVFTGGGISTVSGGDPAGTRSATIKPDSGSLVVPYTFIEQDVLHEIPLAGNANHRYVFAVNVVGTTTSDVYLEAWDDTTHTSTDLPVLSGTAATNYKSMIKAISTTNDYPGANWEGVALAGYDSRVELAGTSSVSDQTLYFNIYVEIPYDTPTFVNKPVLSLRYLYS